ncbi:MFS transporter [Streptosporangium sp. CA-115845]|uniref:MFS transporter n=1 Tax=Streptosporangium sp. CA-115845 TaxID=3240071 RepID=UPI003D8C4C3C
MDDVNGVRKRQVRSAGIASITGWAMDLYDLTVILFVASTIGPLLFPEGNATLQLTFVYASFAVTLLLRPLGSALFGAYADRNGRKLAMLVSISGVGISTALMGAVPTYETAGYLAPSLFLLLRMIQGIFVGGVVASTHTLGTETVQPGHRGLMSGLVAGGGAGAGAVLASIAFFVISTLFPGEAFTTMGWRVMFFTGIVTAIFSFYVYRRTEESPLWAKNQERPARQKSPLRQVFTGRYRTVMLVNTTVTAGGAAFYYLTVGFFPTFFGANIGIEKTPAAIILIIANLGVIAGGIVGGRLSDRYGRRPVFVGFGTLVLVAVPFVYPWLADRQPGEVVLVTVVAALMAFVVMAAGAPMLIFLNERFPTEIRATGTGLSWNLGFAIGGVMPAIVTFFSPEVSDIPSRLAMGIAAFGVLFLLGAFIAGETRHLGLGEAASGTGSDRPAGLDDPVAQN